MPTISRRLALSSLAGLAVGSTVACSPRQTPGPNPTSTPPSSAPASASPSATPSARPFGLTVPSTVEAVVFDGAFGTSYVRAAARQLATLHDGVTATVSASANVSELAPRFADGATPPDLIDNSGAGKLAVASMLNQLSSLEDLMDAPNLEGIPIRDTLYAGVEEAGSFDGKLVAINYALAVYGLWYSGSEFAAQGWKVPATWDEMFTLADQAREQGRSLFVWGTEAATYFQELAISSAIKEGGHEVRTALDNLDEDAWLHPAVTGVLQMMEALVAGGHFLGGGPYLDAQTAWARDGKALLYPSGAWIATETDTSRPEGFELTVAPVPTLTAAPTLPITAAHAAPSEQFIVPAQAKNVAGAKELLRVMLSAEAAAAFSEENKIPTVVRASTDTADPLLKAQTRLLADAGEHVFSWRFVNHYGLTAEHNELWRKFLSGTVKATELAEKLQAISDRVRTDPDVVRYTVS